MNSKNSNTWFVILNPASGNGFVRTKQDKIFKSLEKLTQPYEVKFTEFSKHEELIVKEAIEFGFRKFISVGGDGTLHNVVNGIMKFGNNVLPKIKVAVIPVGTGNDWVKQYDIPKNISKAIAIINLENSISQDIGKIVIQNKDYYFNNLAGFGFDGYVVNTLPKFKKFGSLSYFLSAVVGLFNYHSQEVKIVSKGLEINSKVFLLAIGICKYCGGGMRLTHDSNPRDGLLDITLVKDLSVLSFVLNIAKMYNGRIAKHKKVETYKSDKISVQFKDATKPFLQLDGELIDCDNFEVEVVPNAISFIVK